MSKYSLTLRSDHPSLVVEFNLPPGTHARIGADSDAEICLPLAGLADVACEIGRDSLDRVYVSDSNGDARHFLQLPAVLPLPPYQFVLFHPATDQVPAAVPQIAVVEKNPFSKRAILGIAALLLVLGAGILLAALKLGERGNSDHADRKQAHLPTASALGADSPQLAQKKSALTEERKETHPAAGDVKATSEVAVPPLGAKTDLKPPVADRQIADPKTNAMAEAGKLDLEQLAQRVAPAVFLLEVKNDTGEVIGSGTAFAISADGLAVTNFHVVSTGSSFSARTTQGAEFAVSRVVAVDKAIDLALIELKAQNLAFLELSEGGFPKIGAAVAVFGCPKGLTGTLSEGIISSIRSEAEMEGIAMPNGGKLIQTTAAISPGSSGSPVIDASGKVIGIAVSGFAGGATQNLNFAIPVDALIKLKKESKLGLAASFLKPTPGKPHASPQSKPDPDDAVRGDPVFDEMVNSINVADWIRASKLARGMSARHPDSPMAHAFLGIALYGLNLHDQAETALRASLALNPESGLVWGYLGSAQDSGKKTKEARESWRRALGLVPDDAYIWKRLALSYLAEHDFLNAVSPLENLRKIDRLEFERLMSLCRNLRGRLADRDQLLAHFDAMPDSAAEDSDTVDTETLAASLIGRFLRHGQGQDIQAELGDYAPEVNPYFDQGKRARASILKDITTYRAQWPMRTLQLIALESVEQADGASLEAVFQLRFSASNGTKSRTGVLRQMIVYRRFDDRWLVTGVETIDKVK